MSDQLKSDPAEAMEKLLANSLQRTIDFLKYAEAKNGVLLTFASAWMLAIIRDPPVKGLVLYQYGIFPLLAAAAIAGLLSFFPRMNLPHFLGGRRAGPHRSNLLFFGDVGRMTVSEFHKAVQDHYRPSKGKTISESYIDDLITQIAVNSQITWRKMRLFGVGLWCLAIAGIVFACVNGWTLYQANAVHP